jgi:glycine/D-amino acid oxidase-like deaminating enzyme
MQEFDLAVVGAGIVGAMAAHLARQERAEWRILLVDRSLVGDGATRYSVGLDIPYGRNASQKQYSLLSTNIYRELTSAIPELPVHELPFFGIVGRESAQKVCAGFTTGDVRVATEREQVRLRESYPDLAISESQVLLTGCTARYGFPSLIASALVSRLKEGGLAECWEGVEVQSAHTCPGGGALVTNDGRRVVARRVLVATGPWLLRGPGDDFAGNAGVRIKKVAALHINRRPHPQDPVILFFDEDAFLLPVVQRREWIFSFTSQEWDCTPEVSLLRIGKEERDLALSILERYCPSFVQDCHGGRVFCDAYSQDRAPLVAQVPGMSNFVVAGASSGSGYRLAPAIGLKALEQFS